MRWAALNTFGVGAWLFGIVYARSPHSSIFAGIHDGDHQFAVALTCVAIGGAVLLWANLRSPA